MSAKMNLVLAVIVAVGTISGYIVSAYITSQPVAEITGEIQGVYYNITTLNIDLGSLKPGQVFSKTVNESDAFVTNFDSRCTVYPAGYDSENDAIDSINLEFTVFNEVIAYNTTFDESELINGTRKSFNLPAGNWSIEIELNGKVGYPTNVVPVSFNLTANVSGL